MCVVKLFLNPITLNTQCALFLSVIARIAYYLTRPISFLSARTAAFPSRWFSTTVDGALTAVSYAISAALAVGCAVSAVSQPSLKPTALSLPLP